LNAGIASAAGKILAFVDDDVIVDPRWLQNLTAELTSGEWVGTAGRVLPARPFTPPPWLSWQYCGGILCANFDLGDQPTELDLDHAPYGANMAFRKNAFEKYGGFRLDLGPRPNSQIRNEDVEFGRRLMKAGERLRYEPSAVVYHPVPEGRITKEYFLSWWLDFGRAGIRERDDHADVWGVPWDYFSLMVRLVQISAMTVRWTLALRAYRRFFWKCMVWKQAGMIVELYGRLFDRNVTESAALQAK
jgi:GT2 family glycosyltransferase